MFLIKFPKTEIKSLETQFENAKTQFENAKTQFENAKTQFTGDLLAWTGRAMRSKKSPDDASMLRTFLTFYIHGIFISLRMVLHIQSHNLANSYCMIPFAIIHRHPSIQQFDHVRNLCSKYEIPKYEMRKPI